MHAELIELEAQLRARGLTAEANELHELVDEAEALERPASTSGSAWPTSPRTTSCWPCSTATPTADREEQAALHAALGCSDSTLVCRAGKKHWVPLAWVLREVDDIER